MSRHALLGLALAGCAGAELELTPPTVDFGEVDFQETRPPDGYGAVAIAVSNSGGRTLDLTVMGLDPARLVLSGPVAGDPPALEPLAPGEERLLTLGVWDYALGERDTEVSGALRFTAPQLRDPVPLSWRYVPVRGLGDDTGP